MDVSHCPFSIQPSPIIFLLSFLRLYYKILGAKKGSADIVICMSAEPPLFGQFTILQILDLKFTGVSCRKNKKRQFLYQKLAHPYLCTQFTGFTTAVLIGENVSLLTRVTETIVSCVRILPSPKATKCLKVTDFRPCTGFPMLQYGLALTAPVTWGSTPLSIYIAPDLLAFTAAMTNSR